MPCSELSNKEIHYHVRLNYPNEPKYCSLQTKTYLYLSEKKALAILWKRLKLSLNGNSMLGKQVGWLGLPMASCDVVSAPPGVIPISGTWNFHANAFISDGPDQSISTASKVRELSLRSSWTCGDFSSASATFRVTWKTLRITSKPLPEYSCSFSKTFKLCAKLRSIRSIRSSFAKEKLVGSVVKTVSSWPRFARSWIRGRKTVWWSRNGMGKTAKIREHEANSSRNTLKKSTDLWRTLISPKSI